MNKLVGFFIFIVTAALVGHALYTNPGPRVSAEVLVHDITIIPFLSPTRVLRATGST